MNLAELRRTVREFVALGGLKDWGVAIRLEDGPGKQMTFHVQARVPDRESGFRRLIEFYRPHEIAELKLLEMEPREMVRDLVREFVKHEADEGIGFRRHALAASAWFDGPTTPEKAATDHWTIERPFDPHRMLVARTGT